MSRLIERLKPDRRNSSKICLCRHQSQPDSRPDVDLRVAHIQTRCIRRSSANNPEIKYQSFLYNWYVYFFLRVCNSRQTLGVWNWHILLSFSPFFVTMIMLSYVVIKSLTPSLSALTPLRSLGQRSLSRISF